MKEHACFRVSTKEVSQDFSKYVELARSRTFEIWNDGKVGVLLVRTEAVEDWHRQLQIAVPTRLMTDEEREIMFGPPD